MILFIILMVLILSSVGICLYCFHTCFYASNRKKQDPYCQLHGQQFLEVQEQIYASTRRMEQIPFEAVTIRSFDGLTLYGRYYHMKDGAPVKIIFHGYRSMALRDCAGGFALSRKLGMNVLAVDQRAHGNSGGHVITFGVLERRDCLSWIRYINGRFGNHTPIIYPVFPWVQPPSSWQLHCLCPPMSNASLQTVPILRRMKLYGRYVKTGTSLLSLCIHLFGLLRASLPVSIWNNTVPLLPPAFLLCRSFCCTEMMTASFPVK